MEFNKALDGLPQIAKILLAIFVPILGVIYRIINDCVDGVKTAPLILDILGFFFGIPAFIAWIMDIIDTASGKSWFLWEEWIK
jgi:uncharacterized membrane protein YqaE (UPF0057 family)